MFRLPLPSCCSLLPSLLHSLLSPDFPKQPRAPLSGELPPQELSVQLLPSFPSPRAPGSVWGSSVAVPPLQYLLHSHFSFCLLLLSQPLLMGSLAAADGDQVLLPTSRRCALTARRVIYFLFLLLNTPNSLNGAESN